MCATEWSSRACAFANIGSLATSSNSQSATVTTALTSLSSTTLRQVPKAARSIAAGSPASRACSISPSVSPAASVRSRDAEEVLGAGAEKISVNSPALADPDLINRLSVRFGSQCVVVGVDSQTTDTGYQVHQFTGDPTRTRATARATIDWIVEAQSRGAGEIVLNCMASDGVRQGYDIPQLAAARAACSVPLIASGGAGAPSTFGPSSRMPMSTARSRPASFMRGTSKSRR